MLRRYSEVFIRGVAMGAADVVPGVSGGTVAYITGIYDELIDSIKSINLTAVNVLFTKGFRAFWQYINGSFLLSLFLGIIFSVLSLAKGISYVLEFYPSEISAFFFGLVVASSWYVYRQIPGRGGRLLWLVIGILFAIGIGEIRPAEIEVTPIAIFLSGALAICAMILPGISGSFILLLLGMYQPVIAAIKSLDFTTVLIFSAGCGAGLILFVRFLSWLLHTHRAPVLSCLTGILLGSLSIIWPWKQQVAEEAGTLINMHNVFPWASEMFSPVQVSICVALVIVGVGLVLVLEYMPERQK